MRALREMDTIQVELTNACVLRCANCTRFCGHHQKPFFLEAEKFRSAIDSLANFPHMVGFMGGEPLLHPKFEEFCDYALSKIPRERLGLWTVFPKGKEHLRWVVCRTFGNIFLNDHTREDIYHAPLLVAIQEVIKNEADMWMAVDRCWVQNCWSASIGPKGAFFCEVAGALDELLDGPGGWPVESGWWKRTPKDFTSQIETYCRRCGGALPLVRRSSQDQVDDISEGNLGFLKGKSRKVDRGEYVVSKFTMDASLVKKPYPEQTYKSLHYRQEIAARYGIFLTFTEKQFLEPHLLSETKSRTERKPLFEQYAGIA